MSYEIGSLRNDEGKPNMHLDSLICLLEQNLDSGTSLEVAVEEVNSINTEYFVMLPLPDGEATPGLEKADPMVNDYKYMFMAAAKDRHVVVLRHNGVTLYKVNTGTKIRKLEEGIKKRMIDKVRVMDEALYKDALVFFGIDLVMGAKPVIIVNESERKLIESEKEVTKEVYKTDKPFGWYSKKD